MKSVNTWDLTNNKLHQLFKDNHEFISIKVRGNTWEPITRWLRLDSRIFRGTTSKARITLCDIESLAEIYNYRSIRWKAKKLTPEIAERAAVLANLKKQIATAKVNAQRAATIKAQEKIEEGN